MEMQKQAGSLRVYHFLLSTLFPAVLNHNLSPTGGGAVELEVSRHLRECSRSIAGKEQLFMAAYAKALEVVPRQLCDNAGFDSTIILNKLRARHAEGNAVMLKSDERKKTVRSWGVQECCG